MGDFLYFTGLLYGCLLAGWLIRKKYPKAVGASKPLTKILLLGIESPSILLVYWGIKRSMFLGNIRISLAPILISLVMGTVGIIVSGKLHSNRRFRGAFTMASMVSNNGMTLGGFICLLLLGTEALRLAQMYTLFLLPYVVTVLFTIARSINRTAKIGFIGGVKEAFRDPFMLFPLLAICVGIGLSMAEVPFPQELSTPLRVLVSMSVGGYSVSFGLSLNIRSFRTDFKTLVSMVPIKFVLGPLAGLGFAFLFGFTPQANPLAFKVILIQSMMPTAILSVIISKIYDLDDQIAISLWIFTTILLAAVFPVFKLIAGLQF